MVLSFRFVITIFEENAPSLDAPLLDGIEGLATGVACTCDEDVTRAEHLLHGLFCLVEVHGVETCARAVVDDTGLAK